MAKKLTLVIAALILAPICAQASNKWQKEARQIKPISLKTYESQYPLFAEAAALTTFKEFNANKPGCQIHSIHDLGKYSTSEQNKCIDQGGGGGHGILFLRGACLVPNAPYPQLYNCSNDPKVMADPNSGVGISTNEIFFDVAWVGIPGRQLFYYGDVKPKVDLTMPRYKRLIENILQHHYYHGIIMNPKFLHLAERPANSTDKQWLVDQSIGTDFGSALGRTVMYVRVPISQDQLNLMIGYLDFLNHEIYYGYKAGHTSYWWDIVLNNCSHTVNNAFASAGLVPDKYPINLGAETTHPNPHLIQLGADLVKQIFYRNIAIPSNVVIDVAGDTSHLPFTSLIDAYSHFTSRWFVLHNEQITGPGVIVGANLMHTKTEEFLEGPDPFIMGIPDFLPVPIFNPARRRDVLYTQPRTTQLAANRVYFEKQISALLQEAQAEMTTVETFQSQLQGPNSEDINIDKLSYRDRRLYFIATNNSKLARFQKFAAAYQNYLQQALARLQSFDNAQ